MRRTLLFLLVTASACAPKRQAVPTSIPIPLATALIDSRGSPTRASATFSVAELPAAYPRMLVPTSPARVVGGMTTANETVVVFADSTRRLPAVMEQLFEQHGYTRPQPTPGSGFSSGSGPYSYFCGDSGTVSVEPLMGANRNFARVTYRHMLGSGFCRVSETQRSLSPLVLPELKPPAGVHVTRSHGGTNSEGISSSAEMTGANLSAPSVLAYYAEQLIVAGWTAEPPAVSPRVAAEYFTAKDPTGATWEGVLMASGGGSSLSLSLDMNVRRGR